MVQFNFNILCSLKKLFIHYVHVVAFLKEVCICNWLLKRGFSPIFSQGSATLDNRAGGNIKDYLQTAYIFMQMSSHVLIPVHGRISLWPKHILCGYVRHSHAGWRGLTSTHEATYIPGLPSQLSHYPTMLKVCRPLG